MPQNNAHKLHNDASSPQKLPQPFEFHPAVESDSFPPQQSGFQSPMNAPIYGASNSQPFASADSQSFRRAKGKRAPESSDHVPRPFSPKSPRRHANQPGRSPDTPSQSLQTNAPAPLPSHHARTPSALQSSLQPPGVSVPLTHREKHRDESLTFGTQSSAVRGPNRTVQDVINTKNQTKPELNQDDAEEYEDDMEPSEPTTLVLQPESRPISQQQLAAEVKGIYSGLVMVESKCIAIINGQSKKTDRNADHKPNTAAASSQQMEHFQALIALHRTLLHEHHDFLLASQHPSASQAIKDLASRYSMPARMWKHGIHNFLELLRHRLPESLDYMLAFIYLAYQMMALLFDTVKAFEETWIECLGDLARYRMAIEDEDLRDREIWTGVARMWYLRAVDKNATIGRLYHHLAILARHNPTQQLSSYCRSLTAIQPFLSTRESVLTLFEPLLQRWRDSHLRTAFIDSWFVITHAVMFLHDPHDQLETARLKYLGELDGWIGKQALKWKEPGACTAISNIAGVLKYGCHDSKLRGMFIQEDKALSQPEVLEPKRDENSPDPDGLPAPDARQPNEWLLLQETFQICLARTNDNNVLPHVHVMTVFFFSLARTAEGAKFVAHYAPWKELAKFLNAVIANLHINRIHPTNSFPEPPTSEDCVPLFEDFLMHGQCWALSIFPAGWFERASTDLDERFMERPGTLNHRAHRLLWMAWRLANRRPAADVLGDGGAWLEFEPARMKFARSYAHAPRSSRGHRHSASARPVASPQSFSDVSTPPSLDFKGTEARSPWIARAGNGEAGLDEDAYMHSIESS